MIISILNMKGGVGKTTLTANLALGLAKYHSKRILLVDLDPQFNATQYLISGNDYLEHVRDQSKCTIKDIFIERTSESVGLTDQPTQKFNPPIPSKKNTIMSVTKFRTGLLDLMPSTLDLMEADTLGRGIENRLKNFLDTVKNSYDYILIDCPPTISLFTISAYLASDGYLVPIKPDWLSSIGLPLIDRAILRLSKNYGKKIKYFGIVFVMVKRNKLMRDNMTYLRGQQDLKCFDNTLADTVRIGETGPNKSIFSLSGPHLKYADQMKMITDEFLRRVK